jgi:choline transporter-like protein 2/4/5
MLGHFCIPSNSYTNSTELKSSFKDAFFKSVVGDKGTTYFYDIYKSWAVILVASIVAVIIAYIYLIILRYMGGWIIYISIGLTFVVLSAAGLYSYFIARNKYEPEDPTYDYLAYAAYICWGLVGVLGIVLCCCLNALNLGIAVIETTTDFVRDNMHIFILPAISTLLTGMWFVVWLSSAIFIFSVGTPTSRENFPFITEIKWSDETRGIFAFHVFALLWINAFIIGAVQFIIGAATCIWYFTITSPTKGAGSITKATKWFFRYHWPSVAFGSLIIAICQMIRLLFEYFRKKISTLEKTVTWVKVLTCMVSCCLYCMEKCVKYISKNAYIQVALTNDGFI